MDCRIRINVCISLKSEATVIDAIRKSEMEATVQDAAAFAALRENIAD